MYTGRDSLAQNELSSFLEVASYLKVKWLSQKNQTEMKAMKTKESVGTVNEVETAEEYANNKKIL